MKKGMKNEQSAQSSHLVNWWGVRMVCTYDPIDQCQMKNSMNFSSSALGTHSLVGILVLELGIIVLVVKTSTTHCQYNISELVPEFIQNWFRRFLSQRFRQFICVCLVIKKQQRSAYRIIVFKGIFIFPFSFKPV